MRALSLFIAAAITGQAVGILAPLHRRAAQQNPSPVTATLHGAWFDIEVQIGKQTFYLLVDTISSDTWVAKTGYTCAQPFRNITLDQEICNWTPTYDAPPSLRYVPDQVFGLQEGVVGYGKLAYENITIGGITVSDQIFGIVERSVMRGDGFNGGVLGLGFPLVTSAYPANHTGDAGSLIEDRIAYDPLFMSMFKQDLVEPWFSIALERIPRNKTTGTGGWLGLGELPPVQHTDDWAVAPIEITKDVPESFYKEDPEIILFTSTVESVSWGSSSSPNTSTTAFQARVASNVAKNHLPAELADSINSQFDPPGVFDDFSQSFTVDCNAKAPAFGITIDGHTFWHDVEDLIAVDSFANRCYSTIARAPEGPNNMQVNLLGSTFLKNVVSVFDFGKEEMRFAARSASESPKPSQSAAPADSSSTRLSSVGLWLSLGLVGAAAASVIF